MIIISKFKDYYDYISHLYGVDNTIVYNRNVKMDSSKPFHIRNCILSNSNPFHFAWLLILGKQYKLWLDEERNWNVYSDDIPKLAKKEYLVYKWVTGNVRNINFYCGEYNTKNFDYHIHYKQPVIMFSALYVGVPVLQNIKGFVKLYPPEQIYQDISYFFSAQLNGNPDVNKQIDIDQKYRFEQKGFDNKISFRHRK